jgi:small subunit ribosomal protein S19
MSRSLWKGPFVDKKLLKKLSVSINKKQSSKNSTQFKTFSRQSTIIPKFVGHLVKVYNGQKFVNLKVNSEMVGYKFGEFAPTRQKFFYKKSKNK